MQDSSTAVDVGNALILTQIYVSVKTIDPALRRYGSMAITQAQARSAVEAAQLRATSLDIRVSVAVVDAGGYLVVLGRMDGAPSLSPELAEAKAAGAAVLGRPGDVLADNYQKRPGFFAAASALSRRPLVPGLGSLLVMSGGRLIGAIGVSGGRPEQDLEAATAGLEAIQGL